MILPRREYGGNRCSTGNERLEDAVAAGDVAAIAADEPWGSPGHRRPLSAIASTAVEKGAQGSVTSKETGFVTALYPGSTMRSQ